MFQSRAMTQLPRSHAPAIVDAQVGIGILIRLKATLLRNRVRQLLDQSPMRLLLIIFFVAVIWLLLYAVFAHVFTFLRRFEQPAVIAMPYVFHAFFLAMTALLAFSTAVIVYGALFARAEPAFLLSAPLQPRSVVAVMYLEALFLSSWSLILLGIPLMIAIGQVQGLPPRFYALFLLAFLGFVPIPGALGLVAALLVAMYLPRVAKQTLIYSCGAVLIGVVLWWGRLWAISSLDSKEWLHRFLGELQYLKAALLPSTWVTNTIRFAIDDQPAMASFYLAVTIATALFFSWAAVTIVGARLLRAYANAHSGLSRSRGYTGRFSALLTRGLFFYLPEPSRWLVLKDVRAFLRDPLQWSQLVILFGLLALYLFYLPTTRPDGFSLPWQALICFLSFGAVTLILSTFTSRFVFPMISMEGKNMWLLGLCPFDRPRVLRAKLAYAVTITMLAALVVSALSVRALDLPPAMALVQLGGVTATCIGLCGLAIGLGARMPSYQERNTSRIASGLGGTVNLVASVALVAANAAMMGGICVRLVGNASLESLDLVSGGLFAGMVTLGLASCGLAMRVGSRAFRAQEF